MPAPNTSLPPHITSSDASSSATCSGLCSGSSTTPGISRSFGATMRDLRQIGDLLDVLERIRTVVRAFRDAVVAQLFRKLRRFQVLAQTKLHVVALRILAANDQAEFHFILPLRTCVLHSA